MTNQIFAINLNMQLYYFLVTKLAISFELVVVFVSQFASVNRIKTQQ